MTSHSPLLLPYTMFPALASQQDPYAVDDNQLYHNSSHTYHHLRQYQTPSHISSYSDASFYRSSPSVIQQYDPDPDVVPSLSRMKRVSSSTVIPSSILPPPLPPQYIKSQPPLISSSTPATEVSPDSDSFVPDPPKRKSRQKPKIELAPDQPTTTQGKQRKRVYVACAQCRARKIRCDGAKPACHNCHQRANSNGECNYDPVPRRRGPDKTPGARQRMARDSRDNDSTVRRRRKRRETSSPTSPVDETRPSLLHPFPIVDTGHGSISPTSTGEYIQSPTNYTPVDGLSHPLASPTHIYSPSPTGSQFPIHYEPNYSSMVPISGTATRAYIQSLDDDERDSGDNEDVARGPSLNFTKKIWYDSLCSLYAAPHFKHACQLSNSQRDRISQNISDDLRFLFRSSNYWFSFFHLPSFFGSFYDPAKRETIQPSLILAALAVSTFWQSSEIEKGAVGRHRSLRFRDEAQSALEASFNSGWVDESLAQAAWLLALFEICSHPEHSTTRSVSAIMMLDAIIRSLALTNVDRNDPQASVFQVGGVPSIGVRNEQPALPRTSECGYPTMPNGSYFTASGCSCQSVTLGTHWPQSLEHVPLWAQTPAWDPDWSEAEIKKESCRRLCWSASSLAAGHVSYAVATSSNQPDLFIGDPANYALLFSGESFSRSSSSKDSVWALYDRCFLLWNSCAKMRQSQDVTDAERADFAIKSWLEADNIEAALNRHTCGIEKAFIFQGREYLFNTRMCITYEFQRYVPLATSHVNGLFHRKKAEEWLSHQTAVAKRIMNGLHTITGNSGNLLARRPFFTLWFMGQVSRALSLWQCDQSMVLALDVCKAFLPAIDYLSALWPCQEQRRRYDKLRVRLDDACKAARVPLPPPLNLTLPNPSSVQSIV